MKTEGICKVIIYYLFLGGAAPMVGEIFEQLLPLLDVKKDYKKQIEKN